jgi:ATP-dependent Clp protease protease subunit
MFMYDVIQSSKAPIRMFCAQAYSMGAILFASGNHGRYMLPHGELLLHEPLLGNRVGGNTTSIKSISDSLLEMRHKMNLILAKHTGKSEEEVEKACSFDHYFSPEESIAFGLADEISDFSKMMED